MCQADLVLLTEFKSLRGTQTPRRYGPRTLAMAAGLTDHFWSVDYLLGLPPSIVDNADAV